MNYPCKHGVIRYCGVCEIFNKHHEKVKDIKELEINLSMAISLLKDYYNLVSKTAFPATTKRTKEFLDSLKK